MAETNGFAGAFDPARNTLTIIWFDKNKPEAEYANGIWDDNANPFAGDVLNAYNHGTKIPGQKAQEPFFELESSSPALNLAPGQKATHIHHTMFITGTDKELDVVAKQFLKTSISEIKKAFRH